MSDPSGDPTSVPTPGSDTRLLEGRVAVVTGGGDGIGGGVSRALAANGARVVIAEIDGDRADRTRSGIVDRGDPEPLVHTCDVREAADVEGLAAAAHSYGDGRIDVLVNNVGHYAPNGLFVESTEDDWDRQYATNLLHVLRCTRAFLPGMIDRGSGSIVNVSTVEAFRGIPNNTVYSAHKAGVAQFTRSLAVEVGNHGVRVNGIAPDVTDTPQVPYHRWVSEEDLALVPSWVPLGRFGQPDDPADVVVFLASDQSRFVTGHTIPVDGGTLAAGGWYGRAEGGWTNRPRRP